MQGLSFIFLSFPKGQGSPKGTHSALPLGLPHGKAVASIQLTLHPDKQFLQIFMAWRQTQGYLPSFEVFEAVGSIALVSHSAADCFILVETLNF
jgi:hypothetical protein